MVDTKLQNLYEALKELRLQALETERNLENWMKPGHTDIDQVLGDILDGELKTKMKLVTDCANEVNNELGRLWERSQNRADGYGSTD